MEAIREHGVSQHIRRVIHEWLGTLSPRAKMRTQGGISKGLPQGGVLVPALLLAFSNKVQPILRKYIREAGLYAEDFLDLIHADDKTDVIRAKTYTEPGGRQNGVNDPESTRTTAQRNENSEYGLWPWKSHHRNLSTSRQTREPEYQAPSQAEIPTIAKEGFR